MYRKPAVSVVHALTVAAIAASALLTLTTPAHAARMQHSGQPSTTIYRCDFTDGSVVFSDSRCRGNARVTKWAPASLPKGIHKSAPESPAMQNSAMDQAEMTRGRKDPYVDCKERGGQFRVAARLCILPNKNKATVIQQIR